MELFREKPIKLYIKYNQVLLSKLRKATSLETLKWQQRNEKRQNIPKHRDIGRGDSRSWSDTRNAGMGNW